MPRGLDHIVHAVRDLDAAAELYKNLGFTVGSRNKHPWGTHNRIIQFDGCFIELLTVAEPDKIVPHGARSFSFGAFHREFLTRGQGVAMILLAGSDAAADAEAFRAAGIGDFEVFNFERQGLRPDGANVKLAFSLVYAADPNAPEAAFATCQHHYPENFWNPAFQRHASSVTGLAGVVAVAAEPARHLQFFQSFTGAAAVAKGGGEGEGFAIATPRGVIEVTTPAAFLARFGVPAPDVSRGVRLAALRFTAADASLLNAVPEQAGIGGLYEGNATVIGSEDAMGAVLVFEQDRAPK